MFFFTILALALALPAPIAQDTSPTTNPDPTNPTANDVKNFDQMFIMVNKDGSQKLVSIGQILAGAATIAGSSILIPFTGGLSGAGIAGGVGLIVNGAVS